MIHQKLLASSIVFCIMLPAVSLGQQTFKVTVENNYSQQVSVNRVFDNSERHVVKVLRPGEVIDAVVPFQSEQVFLFWHRGKLLSDPIVFEPRRFRRIGMVIDPSGMVSVQVEARN